jgi:hypothetical protein
VGTEGLADDVLISFERQIPHKESVRGGVGRIAVLLGTVIGTVPWGGVVAGGSEVNVSDAAINLSTLLSIEGSSSINGLGKLDVSEALGAARISVSQDTCASNLTKLFELAVQPLVVDVPAQITNEEILDTAVLLVNLGLLGRSNRLVVGLALLGRLSGLLFVIAGAIGTAARLAVILRVLLSVIILAGSGRVRVIRILLFIDGQ